VVRRREELAEHTSRSRQRARRASQEADSSTPEYGIIFPYSYSRSV
jgi:hypothetical protein